MVTAAMVHSEGMATNPIGMEPIGRNTDASKNKCEQFVAKKFLRKLTQRFPDTRHCIVAVSLESTTQVIDLLGELNMNYLLGVMPK